MEALISDAMSAVLIIGGIGFAIVISVACIVREANKWN